MIENNVNISFNFKKGFLGQQLTFRKYELISLIIWKKQTHFFKF